MNKKTVMTLLDYLLIEQPNKATQVTLGKLNLQHGGNLEILKLDDNRIQVMAPENTKQQEGVQNLVYRTHYTVDVYFIDTTNGKITNHIVDTKRTKEDVVLL